ncbi:MAG: DKNYY domain-containing protein [Acidithiobacillus ferrooxidans]|nr:DKNYY domain-containing protein [Acidithiobacillus ferrooxidans]MDD5378684.1 DKNYY domain-containing protein [Acidithiobacillus sp.]MDD5577229.1 DKNYY domain-containing protein [Acidithiobacillus sp.]
MKIKIYNYPEKLFFNKNFDCEIAISELDFSCYDHVKVGYTLFFDNHKIYTIYGGDDDFNLYKKLSKIYNIYDDLNDYGIYKNLSFPISSHHFTDRLGSEFNVIAHLIIKISGAKNKVSTRVVSQASYPINVIVDLRSLRAIKTITGKNSSWLIFNETVYYAIPYCPEVKRHIKTRADYKTAWVPDDFSWDQFLCDKHHVYRCGVQLKDVDPDSFKVLNPVYAKDCNHVFTSYGNAKVLDPAGFETLDSGYTLYGSPYGYSRDSKHVYWFSEGSSTTHASIVRACHKPDTFLSVGDGFGIDDDFVYLEGKKIPKSTARYWQKINDKFSKDQKHVYFLNRLIQGANPSTFIHVSDCFSKDNKSVFFQEHILPEADAQQWQLITGTEYSNTNEHAYYCEKILPDVHLPSFEVLNSIYAKDANFVYCWGKIIQGADSESFCLISSLTDDYNGSNGIDKFSMYDFEKPMQQYDMLDKFSHLVDELKNKYP